jgi:hypothetical protein
MVFEFVIEEIFLMIVDDLYEFYEYDLDLDLYPKRKTKYEI